MTWQALHAFADGMRVILDQMFAPENPPNWQEQARIMLARLEKEGHEFNDYDRALIECYFDRRVSLLHIENLANYLRPKTDAPSGQFGHDIHRAVTFPHSSIADLRSLTPAQRQEERSWFPEIGQT